MADVAVVFLAVAAVTFVGYVAARVFSATRFPDTPILLGLGLLVGPLNRLAAGRGFGSQTLAVALHPDQLAGVTPLVSALALVVILFDAGLKLDFREFRRSIGPAFAHTMPIFLLTVLALAAVGHWVLGMPPLVASVMGVALSNVGQTVSGAVMRTMRISERTKAIGFVEMAIYDLVSIPILVSMFQFASGGGDAAGNVGESLRSFAQVLSISLVVGGSAGMLWIYALRRLHGHPNSYMLTLAVLLAVYAVNKQLEGAGAVSVLLFGLVVGNREIILKRLAGEEVTDDEEQKVQAFHEEITFFVRTLFFLYLGISFTLGLGGRWAVTTPIPFLGALDHSGALFVLGVGMVLLAFVSARALAITLFSARRDPERKALIPVFGHGLGTAVLATLPFVWPKYVPGTPFHDTFSPWQPVFVNLAFLTIMLTVLASSLLVFLQERRLGPRAAAAAAPSRAGDLDGHSKPRPPKPPARPRGGKAPEIVFLDAPPAKPKGSKSR